MKTDKIKNKKFCFLLRDAMQVNKHFFIDGKSSEIAQLISHKDSILKSGNDCGDWMEVNHDIIYVRGLTIEVNRKKYAFSSIAFKNRTNIVDYGRIHFDHNYTLKQFRKRFCDIIRKTESNKNGDVLFYVPYNSKNNDSSWIFVFKKGYLITITFFNPC